MKETFTQYYKDFQRLMSEAPISYDDETDSYVGKKESLFKKKREEKTKTTWVKPPPVDYTPEEIYLWVEDQIEQGHMVDLELGEGIAKRVMFNDKNSVFKYVYEDKTYTKLQLDNEVRLSEKYKNTKFVKVFAKVLRHGKFWCIQEYADQRRLDSRSFRSFTTARYEDYSMFIKKASQITKDEVRGYIKMFDTKSDIKLHDFEKELYDSWQSIKKSNNIRMLIEFVLEANLAFSDLYLNNLGIKGGWVVILDYGLSMDEA